MPRCPSSTFIFLDNNIIDLSASLYHGARFGHSGVCDDTTNNELLKFSFLDRG